MAEDNSIENALIPDQWPAPPKPIETVTMTQAEYDKAMAAKPPLSLKRGERLFVVPDEGKSFVRIHHHTVMSGRVYEYAPKFEMREALFGHLGEHRGDFSISSSRDTILSTVDVSGKSAADSLAAFGKAMEQAYVDHVALMTSNHYWREVKGCPSHIKIEVRVPVEEKR